MNETLALLTAATLESSAAVLQTLNAALRFIEATIDAVVIFRPECDELVCVFASGNRAEHFHLTRLELQGNSLPAMSAQRGHHLAHDAKSLPLIPGDRAAVAIPLYLQSRLHAVAYIASAQVSRFAELSEIVSTAASAAIPYALACDREADRASATFDGLTGLYTARAFRERVTEQLRVATLQSRACVSLWFIDTDGFKQINDSLGHATGDIVLRRVAEVLSATLKNDGELAGRNGGDEFGALLRAHKVEAIRRAQSFRETVRNCDFGIARPVTVSVGVAAYPHDAQVASALFEAADAAMYHSKRSGRDCVSFADGPENFTVYC